MKRSRLYDRERQYIQEIERTKYSSEHLLKTSGSWLMVADLALPAYIPNSLGLNVDAAGPHMSSQSSLSVAWQIGEVLLVVTRALSTTKRCRARGRERDGGVIIQGVMS
jgi:hypothetical protein